MEFLKDNRKTRKNVSWCITQINFAFFFSSKTIQPLLLNEEEAPNIHIIEYRINFLFRMMINSFARAHSSREQLPVIDSRLLYVGILNALETNRPKHHSKPKKDQDVLKTKSRKDRWKCLTTKKNCHSFYHPRKTFQHLKDKFKILKNRNVDHKDGAWESYDGSAISNLNHDVLENVFMYLNPIDLISLSETSSSMQYHVQIFALHYVSSRFSMEGLDKLFCGNLLTFEEMIIKKRLIRDNGPQLSTALMTFKYLNEYENFVRRSSITTAVVVNRRSQFQKQRYIFREACAPLGRDILRLKQICGLHFEKRFGKVPAGKYQVSIHFQLRGDLDKGGRPRRWNNNCTTILNVEDESANGDTSLAKVAIEPHFWRQIQKDKFDNDLMKGNAFVTKEENSFTFKNKNWFFITLKPFVLTRSTNVVFEWTDMETRIWKDSGRWKEGMCWDFVQIKEV